MAGAGAGWGGGDPVGTGSVGEGLQGGDSAGEGSVGAGSVGTGSVGEGLVGGKVPDEVVERMLIRLAAQSPPVLPQRALTFTGRPWRILVAAGGGLALTLILIGVPVLVGRFL